jgi:hypothetical protein
MPRHVVSNFLGLVGAVLGGALGFFVTRFARDHGFYAMVVPGGFIGLGCGLLAQHRSPIRGLVCGVLALVLG